MSQPPRGTSRDLSTEDVLKLKLVNNIPVEELRIFVEKRRNQMEWFKFYESEMELIEITPLDIKHRIGKLLDSVSKNKESFFIRRKKTLLALLRPIQNDKETNVETITSQELAKNRKILDAVSNGNRYGVTRSGRIEALLEPLSYPTTIPSTEEREMKLQLLEGITVDEFRKALQLLRGRITLAELLK
jgi:antitoxin (DNA-binding transcriptional repressor) of toxin-antitoxin stability system